MGMVSMMVVASLTIGASGSGRQVVVTMDEGTVTNTSYAAFTGNTSGRLVKRGSGHVVFAREIGWGTSGLATTVIVEEGTVSLVSGTNWQLGPDTYAHSEKGMLRFYPVNSTIKPAADASGTITMLDVLGGRATCLNVGRDESVDIGRLGAANRAVLSLVKWRQVAGEWREMTGYYGWTTNGTVVCAELGGAGARLEARPHITGWDISGGMISTTTIPGLSYCILEYDRQPASQGLRSTASATSLATGSTASETATSLATEGTARTMATSLATENDAVEAVVTNAEVLATGEALELAVPDPPTGTRIRFYRVQASD